MNKIIIPQNAEVGNKICAIKKTAFRFGFCAGTEGLAENI